MHGDLGGSQSRIVYLEWAVVVARHVGWPVLPRNISGCLAVCDLGSFGAEFTVVFPGHSGHFTAAGCVDYAEIHGEVF